MIGNFIAGIFSGLWLYVTLFATGATVGVGAFFVGRFTGLLGAAAFGAVALVAAYTSGAVDQFASQRAQAQIAQLEAENEAKAAKIDEIRVTTAELNDFLDEERISTAQNAEVITRLNAKIDAGEDRPECSISKDILDDLKKLR